MKKEFIDLEECKQKELLKKIKPDFYLINSLIKTSELKIKSNNQLELNDITASTKVTIIYDSLREILEAIAIKKGFKIYNHECFCAFLKDICKESFYGFLFNKFRKIRNGINYYGKPINSFNAKVTINEMLKLRKELKSKFLHR